MLRKRCRDTPFRLTNSVNQTRSGERPRLASDWQEHPAECARKRDAAPAASSVIFFSAVLRMRLNRAPPSFALKDSGKCGKGSARSPRRGFTSFEVMISVALLGLVLVTGYQITSRLTRHQAEAVMGLEEIAMARAVLDEYTVTWPVMPRSGIYKDTWEWTITETPQPVLDRSDYDELFEFRRVSVEIRRKHSDRAPVQYFTVLSKRRERP